MRKRATGSRRKRGKGDPYVALLLLFSITVVSFFERNPILTSIACGVIAVVLVNFLLWVRKRRAVHSLNLALGHDLYNESATGYDFEYKVAELFRAQGFKARVTPGSGDKGIDIILEKNEKRYAVQCKRYSGQVGPGEIREFIGALDSAKVGTGYFVTTGQFTRQAEEAAMAGSYKIYLFDGAKLGEWQRKIRGKGETAYTAFVPLKQWVNLGKAQRTLTLTLASLGLAVVVSLGIYFLGNQLFVTAVAG